MPNVLLTQKCVRSCPYCFAKKHMSTSDSSDMITWENLIYIADLIQADGGKGISLLGGEPTLHPDYADFVIYLLERGLHVTTFTSGIMPEEKLQDFSRVLLKATPGSLGFVCNLNDPELSPPEEVKRVERFLELFGSHTSPGFNIYRQDFSLDFLFQYINRYGLHRHLRLGLAHPIPKTNNSYIKPEDMRKMYERLIGYFPLFEKFGVTPGFDCGFPLCLMSDEEVGRLAKLVKGHIKFGCGPAIDIGPDMTVWSCFPLSAFKKRSVFEFNSMGEIIKYYQDMHNSVRVEASGLFEACDTCKHKKDDMCTGGCLAHALKSMENEEKNIRKLDICAQL